MSIPHPTPDQVANLLPDYANLEEIGRGGFKTVFRALHAEISEVIKLIGLPKDGAMSDEEKAYREECMSRAMREIKILAQCESQHIVKLGSLAPQIVEIDGFDYVAYSEEFLSGVDLGELIKLGFEEPPSQKECVSLLLCLLHAIKELWSKNVVHRDIKPQNVMRLNDPKRRYVLLDLGIAFSVIDTALTFGAHNRLPPATFKYLAPEMANPNFRQSIDYRSDLYSAALTVFEYAARMHPLAKSGDDLFQTISRAVQQPPKPLSSFRNDFSPEFCALIDQLLKKKPTLRPANLMQLQSRLEKML